MSGVALLFAVILFVVGLVGTVLPVLPGAILIYGGMLLYGFMTGFAALDANFFLLQAMALIIIFAVDFLATAAGTKHFGGSNNAVWGAILGTLAGLLIFGPFGIIIGPFLGATLAELRRGKQPNLAFRAGFGTLIGLLGSTILKLSIEILMIIHFFLTI